MKKLIALILAFCPTVAFASERFQDNSGIFSWIFLGFCALIVAMQIVPAVLMAGGIMRGLFGKEVKAC